jgi:hypothetical protein
MIAIQGATEAGGAMVERNEKGKQARLYFIECERKLRAGPDLTGLAAVLTAALAPITARFERLESALTARNEPTTFVPPWVGRDICRHITALAKARTKSDPARYRRERGCVELELRVRFGFGPGAGKAWRAFPAAQWPEMRARLDEMERETTRALTGTQLTLC